MAIRDISVPMRVALPCYVIGKIIFFVSFSVNYWLEDSDDHFNAGLWKLCFSGDGAKACYLWTDTDTVKGWQRDWLHKTQAMECLALVLLVVVLGALVVFWLSKMKVAVIISAIACFLSATLVIIACIVFAKDLHDDNLHTVVSVSWAFGFNIVSGVFLAVAGGALVGHIFMARPTGSSM